MEPQPSTARAEPRAIPHTFWNATTKPARLLELISPAGFERYFAELADLLPTGGGVDQITNLVQCLVNSCS